MPHILTHKIGQVVAALGLVVLAVAAFLNGTDRLAQDLPNSAAIVGWPYDTGAAQARAISEFVQHGPVSAISYARRSILSDPLSSRTVSLLGRSQLAAGQLAEARKTFEVAGKLGWRDELTQIYWLDQAMQSNDLRSASERLDALLRQNPGNEDRDRFLAHVSEGPDGRAMIAERLKKQPVWAASYVTTVRDLSPDELRQRVDVVLRAGRGLWDCQQTSVFVQGLIGANLLNEAQAVWRMNCAPSNSLVYDGGFDQIDPTEAGAGFEWQLSNRGDVSITASKGSDGNQRLDLAVQGVVSVPIIQQLLLLDPGRYRIIWRTPDTTPAIAGNLRVALSCKQDLREAAVGSLIAGKPDTYILDLNVDATCRQRLLTFWLAPGSAVHIDDVMLQSLARK
jgi:hypothetical protein